MRIIKWTKYVSPETKFYSKMKKKSMFLTGPNGIVFPDSAMDKKFNMYEGIANFPISMRDMNIINGTDGVEMVYIITAYRLMIAVAPMFNDKDVLDSINKAVDPYVGIHDHIISRYHNLAKQKYPDYVLFEDFQKMIHITNEENEPNVQGFTILRANPKPSGV